jgi:hypothetical protein
MLSEVSACTQAVSKVITVTNQLSTTVEATLRAGSSDRYTVHPQQIRLKPGQTTEVEIRLKVVRFAQVEKAVEHGQRDTFHIRTPFFDQKFTATFFLSPQHLQQAGSNTASARRPPAGHISTHSASAPSGEGPSMPKRWPMEPAGLAAQEQARHRAPGAVDHSQQPPLFSFRLPASPAPLPARDRSTERQGIGQLEVEAQVQHAVHQALQEERDAQEARNSRVLDILHAKDAAIAEGQTAEEELQRKVCMLSGFSRISSCSVP